MSVFRDHVFRLEWIRVLSLVRENIGQGHPSLFLSTAVPVRAVFYCSPVGVFEVEPASFERRTFSPMDGS